MSFVMDAGGAWVRETREEFIARVQAFEKRIQANMRDVMCPVHLCLGQEEGAAELSQSLRSEDWIFTTHRNHGHYLSKGGNESKLWDEIMGLETGLNKGFAGSQGISDPGLNFHASAIVGGLVGVATGTALAMKLKGSDAIVVCITGDGGTEAGVFWESMNFSALHCLPIVFICENNGKSVDARIDERQLAPISSRVRAFGVPVMPSVKDAIREARQGVPAFCELKMKLDCYHINMSSLLPKWS